MKFAFPSGVTREADTIRVVAHRGASACAPENTLSAFHTAVSMGAVEVEADTRLTTDGHPILIHDATLERTTDGEGLVGQVPLAVIKQLNAASWPQDNGTAEAPPELDDLFAQFSDRLIYHVDLRVDGEGLAEEVALAAKRRNVGANVIVTGTEMHQLQGARAVNGAIRIGWTVRRSLGTLTSDAVREAVDMGVTELVMHVAEAPRWLVRYARRSGMHVRFFGLANDAAVVDEIEGGATALTLDDPSQRLLRRIGARYSFELVHSRLAQAA